ncbi:serine protease [Vibrio sinensis]|uniref:Serine protease n=1 Tax=Vibrio sinensis TaxID=2302434 RepID=A0A3A6QBL6_9VIBR|nr:trypsin-like serine protease [Vibrio sinensis]RJX69687.1 serine protease [Vibrio sinensis]
MKYQSLLLSVLITGSVSAQNISPYIINGNPASIVNFPSFASLYFDDGKKYGYTCGATMLNQQYVLTAAHCIVGDESLMLNSRVVVQLQNETDYVNGNNMASRGIEYYYPDNYVDDENVLWPNDIAIIKLQSPLNISDFSSLINTTQNDNYPINPGNPSFVTIGHGLEAGNVEGGTALLKTELQLIDGANICGTSNKQLCFDGAIVGDYKNSTCNGDSGGPVYWWDGAEYKQIGITSYGPNECGNTTSSYTSVFTEVYDYQDWITSVLAGTVEPQFKANPHDDKFRANEEGGGSSWYQLGLLGLALLLRRRNR